MTHPNITASLVEVEQEWSIVDVLDAHLMLDAIDAAQQQGAQR